MPRTKKTAAKEISVENTTQSVAESTTDEKPKQLRQQLAGVIDVAVSTARTRNMLTDMGVNANVKSALDEIAESTNLTTLSEKTVKQFLNAYADIVNPESEVTAIYDTFKLPDVQARSSLDVEKTKLIINNLLSRHLIRAGDDSVCALAATANWIIMQIANHGVKTLISESKKTLKPRHIVNDEITSLSVWPFLRTLPCVQAERESYKSYLNDVDRKKTEKKEKDKAKKVAKASSKPEEDVSSDKKTEDVNPIQKEDVSDDDDVDSTKKKREKNPSDSFRHHAYNIIREIVHQKVDGDISNDVRRFGSNIIYELIQRYVRLITIQLSFAGVKTIKSNTITTINKLILADAGVDDAEFDAYIQGRLSKYEEHSASLKMSSKPKVAVK